MCHVAKSNTIQFYNQVHNLFITGDFITDDHDNVDGTTPQTFHYELLTQSTLFTIRNSTLYNTNAFDYETQNNYKLKVKVTDSGVPPLSLQKEIEIRVLGKRHSPFKV